ncbi:mg18 protein [Tupanvirus deep ocean]|uniref:Mg18 protein n=2 Tax=Tupanvirus TaxID=2094720 RepID=A0AC62A887_9VIRU|nr:mg18 protein [Tupanvirus deep ocean]QKU33867.1 mg18 protein [Tupanvirus deep ocean]
MGLNNSKNNEPSLLLQLYGKNNSNTNMIGGSTEPETIDFEEDFIGVPNHSVIFKASQLEQKMSFDESRKIKSRHQKINLHLGQLKLFFSELLFLTKYIKDVNKVLYVGAAAGYHISKLADLFPDVVFDLWDPGRFDLQERNNIKIFNYPFTNESARTYAINKEKILFMSDIRTLTIAKMLKSEQNDKVDEIVEEDMLKQAQWVKIINPVYAYLKFRLPWYSSKSKYLKGTIYLQPYSPLSTEARLMTNNYNDYVVHDNVDYDEKMAYFNRAIRPFQLSVRWENILNKYDLLNTWDTVLSLYITDYYLRKMHNIRSDEETGKLFMSILNFHIDVFGKKYDVVFNQ